MKIKIFYESKSEISQKQMKIQIFYESKSEISQKQMKIQIFYESKSEISQKELWKKWMKINKVIETKSTFLL